MKNFHIKDKIFLYLNNSNLTPLEKKSSILIPLERKKDNVLHSKNEAADEKKLVQRRKIEACIMVFQKQILLSRFIADN